jgi:hypothetical protein
MTLCAVCLNMRPSQRECSTIVIKVRVPIECSMANRTIMREIILQMTFGALIVILMASPAIRRCTAVNTPNMTLCAVGLNVRTRQRKCCAIMIEVRVPIGSAMTNRTITRETVLYMAFGSLIIALMARPAVRRNVAIISAHMTLCAVGLCMHSSQWKRCIIVTEIPTVPAGRVVANRAIVGVIILYMIFGVLIVILVTRPAVRRSPTVNSACMTLGAIGLYMRPSQRKRCVAMIKVRIPIGGAMTNRAIVRETILHMTFSVLIINLVARPTVRRSTAVYSSNMTLYAVGLYMRPSQRERRIRMIKVRVPIGHAVADCAVVRIFPCQMVFRAVVIRFVT